MKEEQFNQFISKIDTDISMDQRITEKLLDQNTDAVKSKRSLFPINLTFVRSKYKALNRLSKIAAAVVLLALVGTSTAFAAGYFIKSYQSDFKLVPETDSEMPERNITHFGNGHKNESSTFMDAEGNVTATIVPEDPNHEDATSGDDIFAVFGLPNLTPTVLYDDYLLGEGGYCLEESTYTNGTSFQIISADFFVVNSSKHVYFYYTPLDKSTKGTESIFADNNLTEADCKESTYTTKGGLICNLIEIEKYNNIDAAIYFDSKELGNGSYFISTSDVPMEEVKAILDSIPITVTEE